VQVTMIKPDSRLRSILPPLGRDSEVADGESPVA